MIRNLFFVLFLLKTSFFFSQNPDKAHWMAVNGPNYTINQHLDYPYSNEDCASTKTVTTIPARLNSYVHLVDFYGEGRIEYKEYVLGFKSAYNINLEYQLVSRGTDKGRRIPNRIPVTSKDGDLGLSRYIASDRVTTVTLMQKSALKLNTFQEMARIVRKDRFGKIILYGFKSTDPRILVFENELAKIGYSYTPDYVLEPPFNEIRGFQNPTRVYQSKKITATEETVFYSLNPKTDQGITQSDMTTLNYTSLLALGADLSGGIKGTINKPGGKIEVEVFAYDNEESDGIQKFASADTSGKRNKTVYKVFTDVTSTESYIEKTVSIPFGFDQNIDGTYRTLGETQSNNIKLLGASSSSGWADSGCNLSVVRLTRWLTWNIKSLFYRNIPYECQDVVTNIRSGKHPVLLKVTLKDATLYHLKIPGVTTSSIDTFIKNNSEKLNRDSKKKLQEYKVIKNLKITVFESPNESRESNYYTDEIIRQIKDVNRYFTAKTNYVRNALIAAEIGNPRILFNKASIIIKKGTSENYIISEHFINEAAFNQNDAETLQIVYVHSLKENDSPDNSGHILGYTYNNGDIIQNPHFCSFSYASLFNADINLVGNAGSTLAHELGHYFNLRHPFFGGCAQTNGGDMVDDTPPCEGDEWNLQGVGTSNIQPIANPCENAPRNCNGLRRQVENIMDYGPCRWLFTKAQANRMIDRINTKPSLFTTLLAYDSAIDPNDVTVTINDQRHGELRKKRSLEHYFAIEVPASGANSEYRTVSITAYESGNVTIRIYALNSIVVYENNVVVKEGQNTVQIASNLFKSNTLYIISCSNEYATERIKFISRHY